MSASIVPALIDALKATAISALPNALVLDGVGVTDDPGDYLMIGTDDPDSADESEAVSMTQTQMAFGSTRPRREQGVIHLAARSIDGGANQKTARDAVYALQEALASALRTGGDLGVTGVLSLSNGANLRLTQNQDSYGARATLLYDIAFDAQI
jgi:hypothetical protein